MNILDARVCACVRSLASLFVLLSGFFNYFIFVIFIFFVLPARLSSVTSARANKRKPVNWEDGYLVPLSGRALSTEPLLLMAGDKKDFHAERTTVAWYIIWSGRALLSSVLLPSLSIHPSPNPPQGMGWGKSHRWHGSFRLATKGLANSPIFADENGKTPMIQSPVSADFYPPAYSSLDR